MIRSLARRGLAHGELVLHRVAHHARLSLHFRLSAVVAEKAVSVPGVQHRRVAWEAIILRRSFTRQGSWMCHGRSGRSCVAKSIGVR